MQSIFRALPFLCVFLFTAGLEAKSPHPQSPQPINRTLSISYTEFPPFTHTSSTGKAQGYFVDLIADLLDDLNISYTFIPTPTPRIHHQLKSGELDIYLGPRGVPGLQPHIRIIPIPDPFSIQLKIWRRPDTPNRENLDALKNQRLVIINGFGYGGLAKQLSTPGHDINIFNSGNHDKAIKMLISGRADYLLDYQRPVQIELAKHPVIKLLSHPVMNIPVAFMVSRRAQNSQHIYQVLLASVEKHFAEHNIPTSMTLPDS